MSQLNLVASTTLEASPSSAGSAVSSNGVIPKVSKLVPLSAKTPVDAL